MAITPLPDPPSRANPADFAAKGDAFLGALPGFCTEANALALSVNNDKTNAANSVTEAANSKDAAALSAIAAEASAQSAAAISGAGKWISGETYSQGDCAWSPTDYQTYRRKTDGSGTVDPATDQTNWVQIQVAGPVVPLTGGGTLQVYVSNELHDSGTYSLPLAASVAANTYVDVDLPDLYKEQTPVVQCQGSDTIAYSGGADTAFLFDAGSMTVRFVSDGVDSWRM